MSSDGWNYGDLLEAIALEAPDRTALVRGDETRTFAAWNHRAAGLASAFVQVCSGRHARVGQYLTNRLEYLDVVLACFKASVIPFNVNHRYGADELAYLFDEADAEVIVFEGRFAETIERIRRTCGVRLWVWVDDGSGPCPPWASDLEVLLDTEPVAPPWCRSIDDPLFLFTGGTTGLPKAVIWRQHDLAMTDPPLGRSTTEEPDAAAVARSLRDPQRRVLIAAPLMHGSGLIGALFNFPKGDAIHLLAGASFDPAELLSTIERERIGGVVWVGDAFARPTADALDAEPGRWDLTSWDEVTSTGVAFSSRAKQALMAHAPHLAIRDGYGSSETGAIGLAQPPSNRSEGPVRFAVSKRTRVLRSDGTEVEPGSGEVGQVVVGGRLPVGYHNDPVRTAATFVEFDGSRFVLSGDEATVETDGTITLLGRGSSCINTGGEKVHAEEVEGVLVRHPAIRDAVVVGVPDPRFGEAIAAVLSTSDPDLDQDEVIAFVKQHLAAYKAPRRVLRSDEPLRLANGKPDYALARRVASLVAG